MGEESYVDLTGCAQLLGVSKRELQRMARGGGFAEPAGHDAGQPYWQAREVQRWAAAQGPDLAAGVPVDLWPPASGPAQFLGATRHRVEPGLVDDVVLRWSCPSGVVGMLWRPTPDASRSSIAELAGSTAVLVRVEGDFGIYGPSLAAVNLRRPDQEYEVSWPELAAVLGRGLPYWPLALIDPELIAAWRPGAAVVEAPARTDVDPAPLLRMASLFEPGHATHRTLMALVQENQRRATRSALADLDTVAELTKENESYRHRWPGLPPEPMTVAARPLQGSDELAGQGETDPTVTRIGWSELLARTDPLSWACVTQCLLWDGGRWFPFSSPQRISPTTGPGAEWSARLEPLPGGGRPAVFAQISHSDAAGGWEDSGDRPYRDPLTEAPAVVRPDGEITAAIAQRLPALRPLAEVILEGVIWVRAGDGTLFPAPRSRSLGPTWGYGGTGPGVLAALIARLLDDVNAAAPDSARGAPQGLRDLTALRWPSGTVLDRALLEAARDGRPWNHPNRPAA